MESCSLMLLLMLVFCSLILNQETISVSGRRNDGKLWSNPFEKLVIGRSKFRKSDAKPEKNFELMVAFHPDDLQHVGQPKLRWEDRSSTFSGHKPIKYVDPPVKLTTARLKPNLIDIPRNSQRYQDIVFSINQKPDNKLDGNVPSKEKPAKPFWGPPIENPSTAKPTYYARPTTRKVPFMTKEESSVYHQSNIWEYSTFDSKIGDYNKQNHPNEMPKSPEHILEQPIHMQFGPPYQQENEPSDQSLSHRDPVTEPTTFFNNPIPRQSYFHPKHLEGEIVSKDLDYSGILETPVPAVILKEIDSSALASYPAPHHPPSQDQSVVYHHQAPAHNYYHPPSGLTHIDFSPIFLAIVPIALFLGAAAAFALASAVTSNTAVATAQQQQQQQEDSNSNNNNDNNANNNNNLAILATILEFIQSKHDSHDDKHKIILITTTTAATTTIPVPTIIPPPPPPPFPFFAAKDVPLHERFANQSASIPPDKPLSEEDELAGGFDLPGGGTVIQPPVLEEEEPEILTYDL